MKTGIFKYSLLMGVMVFSGLTMAANPSATLAVKGQVSTGTCTAVLDTPNVDLGTTSTDKIPATGGYEIKGNVSTVLRVNCTSPLRYQISLSDNRKDSVASGDDVGVPEDHERYLMGLGKTSDDINIGAFDMGIWTIDAKVDGKAVSIDRIGKTLDQDSDWYALGTDLVRMTRPTNSTGTDGLTYISIGAPGTTDPYATTSATFDFRSYYYLSSQLQSITDQAQIDGSMTFNLDYL